MGRKLVIIFVALLPVLYHGNFIYIWANHLIDDLGFLRMNLSASAFLMVVDLIYFIGHVIGNEALNGWQKFGWIIFMLFLFPIGVSFYIAKHV